MDPSEKASSSEESSANPASDPRRSSGAEAGAFASVTNALTELLEYIRYYLSVKFDIARLAGRRLLVWMSLILMGAIAAMAVVVAAMVLICFGIAHALGELFHVQWLADIVTGLGALAVIAMACRWVVHRSSQFAMGPSISEKYEKRRKHQRNRFGRDVGDWEHVETDYE